MTSTQEEALDTIVLWSAPLMAGMWSFRMIEVIALMNPEALATALQLSGILVGGIGSAIVGAIAIHKKSALMIISFFRRNLLAKNIKNPPLLARIFFPVFLVGMLWSIGWASFHAGVCSESNALCLESINWYEGISKIGMGVAFFFLFIWTSTIVVGKFAVNQIKGRFNRYSLVAVTIFPTIMISHGALAVLA